jgi:hypothetical protein
MVRLNGFFAHVGGNANNGDNAGVFALNVNNTSTNTNANNGAALTHSTMGTLIITLPQGKTFDARYMRLVG